MSDLDEANQGRGAGIAWSERSLGVATIGPVCIVVWRENVTAERFRRQELALQDVVRRYPREAGFLCVVEAGTTPPDERLRNASAEMIDAHGDRLRCLACVIEGSGFRAALTRSALSGIALLIARRELKFAATVSAAAAWMAPRCGVLPPARLIDACATLRAHMDR